MAKALRSELLQEWPVALTWAAFLAITAAGSALYPQNLGFAGSFIALGAIFAIMMLAVFRVVHHAEGLAMILGEPLGTLILTVSVIGIEVALITAVMLTGDNTPTLARDTMFSVLMIVMNGLVGLCLLAGGLRHGLQVFNLSGANAYLVVLLPVSITALVLPSMTVSAPGGGLSGLQTVFQIVISTVLYVTFLLFQTIQTPAIFRQPEAAAEDAGHGHHFTPRSVPFHTAGLLMAMLPLVLMAKKLAVYVDFAIVQVGAPIALGGFIVAIMILTPEGLAAIDSARKNQLQRAVNICLGSALATIGMTVPAVLLASWLVGLPIELGLEPPEITLLALTLTISIITFVSARTNTLQGIVHLAVFAAYIVLIFDV